MFVEGFLDQDTEEYHIAYTRGEAGEMQDAVRRLLGCDADGRSSYDLTSRDNLEFLQWVKKFWDANYHGQGYDPVSRRKGVPLEAPATIAPLPASRSGPSPGAARAGGRTPIGGPRAGSAQPEALNQLRAQVAELTGQLEGLEKERDFYFEKVCLFRSSCLEVED